MFRRNLEILKRSKGDENADEEISAVKGNKQFGPSAANKSFIRSNSNSKEAALKLKSNNQKNDSFHKDTNEKQNLQVFNDKAPKTIERTNIPLKRGESAIGQLQHSQSKKQDVRVERTYRHKEEEQEWEPQGLNLDFSAFSDTAQESSYHFKDQLLQDDVNVESFLAIERQFTTTAENPSIDNKQDDREQSEIEHDTSTVEYGPPKEQEIPYKPDQSCIVDVCDFTPYADIDAYEYSRLERKHQTFSLYQDPDVFEQNMIHPINDETLEFDYDSEGFDQDSDLSNDLDFSSIPFSDHLFDVEYFIQSN